MMQLKLPSVLTRSFHSPLEGATLDAASLNKSNVESVSGEDASVSEFLDGVIRHLTRLPPDTRADVRNELRSHLESLIVAHEELGDDREAAAFAAIRQFGEPKTIAARFVRAWQSTAAYQNPLAAMRIGLIAFSVAAAAWPLAISPLLSSLQLKSGGFFLNPFVLWAFLSVFFWFPPICAGVWVARRASNRAALGSFLALSALACVFLPLSLLELSPDGGWVADLFGARFMNTVIIPVCYLGGFMFVLWLPIGCLAACVTAFVGRTRNSGNSKRASA